MKTLELKANRLGIETYFLDKEQAKKQEPSINAYSVLVSPSTGIVDSHSLMDYLEQQVDVALCTRVKSIQPYHNEGYILELSTSDSKDVSTIVAKRVFNSGGLHADKVSNMLIPNTYKLHYARGHYYAYNQPLEINHLIYPCPEKNLAGLGTHLTLDLAGRIKFGPDVQYIESPFDYSIPDNDKKKDAFIHAIHDYLPSLNGDKLHADYSGIR